MNKYKKCEFSITPQKNSDYIICIECYYSPNNWSKTPISFQSSIEGEKAIQLKNNTAYFNFVLKEGITYTFCINNTDDNINSYNITISQNNWVFAPYGCYKSYSELFPLKTYSEYYLPDKLVYNIIKRYRIEKEGENY